MGFMEYAQAAMGLMVAVRVAKALRDRRIIDSKIDIVSSQKFHLEVCVRTCSTSAKKACIRDMCNFIKFAKENQIEPWSECKFEQRFQVKPDTWGGCTTWSITVTFHDVGDKGDVQFYAVGLAKEAKCIINRNCNSWFKPSKVELTKENWSNCPKNDITEADMDLDSNSVNFNYDEPQNINDDA